MWGHYGTANRSVPLRNALSVEYAGESVPRTTVSYVRANGDGVRNSAVDVLLEMFLFDREA